MGCNHSLDFKINVSLETSDERIFDDSHLIWHQMHGNKNFPSNAFLIGFDQDNKPLYAARAKFLDGSIIIGKTSYTKKYINGAKFPYLNNEKIMYNYEILIGCKYGYKIQLKLWKARNMEQIPYGSVIAGCDSLMHPFYVGIISPTGYDSKPGIYIVGSIYQFDTSYTYMNIIKHSEPHSNSYILTIQPIIPIKLTLNNNILLKNNNPNNIILSSDILLWEYVSTGQIYTNNKFKLNRHIPNFLIIRALFSNNNILIGITKPKILSEKEIEINLGYFIYKNNIINLSSYEILLGYNESNSDCFDELEYIEWKDQSNIPKNSIIIGQINNKPLFGGYVPYTLKSTVYLLPAMITEAKGFIINEKEIIKCNNPFILINKTINKNHSNNNINNNLNKISKNNSKNNLSSHELSLITLNSLENAIEMETFNQITNYDELIHLEEIKTNNDNNNDIIATNENVTQLNESNNELFNCLNDLEKIDNTNNNNNNNENNNNNLNEKLFYHKPIFTYFDELFDSEII